MEPPSLKICTGYRVTGTFSASFVRRSCAQAAAVPDMKHAPVGLKIASRVPGHWADVPPRR